MTLTPERWQRARDVLHEAMRMAQAEPPAFLDSQCASDPSLRAELNELLAAEDEIGFSFLEKPAVAHVAQTEASGHTKVLPPGTKLGPYVVQSLIGAGGMGEVYRARDTRLNRVVAIKTLPAASSSDGFRRQRLQREARAISALQHPNICTLFDVCQQDGIDYLVMELLEGETLASRLEKVRLSPHQVLAYGIEIADALDTAQHRGIIHRDLKPGNIFLTSHGECKLLDFGLAKVSDDSDDAATLSQPDVLTSPGVAIGTVAYMSPEQARGEPLDARTDIFSLGAVLYKMATGKSPFAGRTSALTFKAILDSNPPPPSQANKAIPPKLDEVIGKCLEKDRELRYQAAAELRTDLKRIKRDSDSQKISAPVAASPTSHSKRARAIKILVATVAVLVVIGGGVFYWWTHRPLASIAFQHYAVKPLTTCGNVRSLDLSRDGRYLAYTAQVGDQYSLWVQQIATFSNVRILGPLPPNMVLDGVGFSPDGNYLY